MNLKRFISDKEHKLLLAVACAALIFSISGYIAYTVKAEYDRSEYFRIQEENWLQNKPVFSGPYCHPDKHPGFLISIVLLLGATFFSLCFAKWYLLSTLLTIASFSRFVYWFFDTRKELIYDELGILTGINRIFYRAGDFDLAALFLLSILLFWQISILMRILIKSSPGKNVLP